MGGMLAVSQRVRDKCSGSRKSGSKTLKTKYLDTNGDVSVQYMALSAGK